MGKITAAKSIKERLMFDCIPGLVHAKQRELQLIEKITRS
jgi:hypothetical protein